MINLLASKIRSLKSNFSSLLVLKQPSLSASYLLEHVDNGAWSIYWGRVKNFARAVGLVPPFFKPGYSTVPGVYCSNYAVANVASVAIHATLQIASPSSSRRLRHGCKWARD